MRKLIDLYHPFFAPAWIRVAIVIVLAAWGLFELSTGAVLWAIIFIGIGVICAWQFATIDYSAISDE
ncbi:hypothetical protein Q4555_05490 [Octadecabacter sp. 1_MG-2023]|uniref:hypothetical protein n=1 Tax=unclassified Octadecabacter TaxID=196158 RepID=UPI001C0882CF|nr:MULTISPECIES: hypothetical protein [unclassified Octadecabacter]MBU2994596.1 hypothetical protein [Octadecabacter sp. B2R22]MDO6734111.1 hypothetical protein [Octadecabacter sp. 1_MG-2023]